MTSVPEWPGRPHNLRPGDLETLEDGDVLYT